MEVTLPPLLAGYRTRPSTVHRPHLHPLRTLRGHVVTDLLPADHPWHAGLSVAVPLVDGTNFWGGPTYRRGLGYVDLADHGVIEHRAWSPVPDGFVEDLSWRTRAGEVLLDEQRTVRVLDIGADAWTLSFTTRLRNVTARTLVLRTPATEGRVGAGYGGVFWRGSPDLRGAAVFDPTADGEDAVHAGRAPWIALAGPRATMVFVGDGEWFVRSAEYPGVCLTVAAREPRPLAPGTDLTRTVQIVVADGTWSRARVQAHLTRR